LSRPHRLDFHGAIHIVHVRGRQNLNIYFDASALACRPGERWKHAPHLLRFLQLLDECCSECGAQLLGYCVEPNDCSLILRVLGASLDACMQRLGGRYSRYLHSERVVPKSTYPFAARYESKVLAPEYLPHAVRRVHGRPLKAGLASRAVDYPFSSARTYMGERAAVRLETQALWRALELKRLPGLRGYREFMEQAESPHVTELFEQGSALDVRVVGGKLFVAQARDAAGHPSPPATQEQLIAGVAQLLGVAAAELFSTTHQGVLGRALVAWYALRLGVASLREVAMWFEVSGAALGQGIRHYRRVTPELFGKSTLPGIEIVDQLKD
jgi:putative transposase